MSQHDKEQAPRNYEIEQVHKTMIEAAKAWHIVQSSERFQRYCMTRYRCSCVPAGTDLLYEIAKALEHALGMDKTEDRK